MGKNLLKFILQIANRAKPNAHHKTVVIAIAAVRDTIHMITSLGF